MAKRLLSKTKLDELKKELEVLKLKRHEITDRIKEAKGYGDLSENSEYHEAKDAWAFNEGRIQEIEEILRNATLIEEKSGKQLEIIVGSAVKVKVNRKGDEFQIVDPQEADPLAKKISIESPIGKALVGKRVGDEVMVTTPKGPMIYKVVGIK